MRPAHYHHFSNRLKEPVEELPLKSSLSVKRGGNDPTFARNSTGTFFGFSSPAVPSDTQLMLTADSNEIRFDGARRISAGLFDSRYSDGVMIPDTILKGYLAEGSRTNLFFPSESLGNDSRSTFTQNSGPSPRGDATATLMEGNIANEAHVSLLQNDIGNAGLGCYSIHVKEVMANYATVIIDKDNIRAEFNLSTLEIVSTSGNTTGYSSTDIKNGWSRLSVSGLLTIPSDCRFYIADTSQPPVVEPIDGSTSSTYHWGAQFEQFSELEPSSFASSYIHTTTASVTRNEDVLSKPFYKANNKRLTVSLEYNSYHAPSGTVFLWGSYTDTNNYVAILHDGTNLIARKRVSGSNTDAVIANAFSVNTFYKVLAIFTNQKCSIYLNKIKGADAYSLSDLPLAAGYEIGSDGNGSGQCFMNIRNYKIFDYDLSDIQARRLQ